MKIPEFSGEKIYDFRNFSDDKENEYPMIYTRDTVLYINEQHPNHLKKAIVTQHSIIGDKNKICFYYLMIHLLYGK